MKMTMHNVIRTIFSIISYKIHCIKQWNSWVRIMDYTCIEQLRFSSIRTFLGSGNHKIQLKLISIYMTKYMHEPCFCATSIEAPENMQNLYFFSHCPFIIFSSCIEYNHFK